MPVPAVPAVPRTSAEARSDGRKAHAPGRDQEAFIEGEQGAQCTVRNLGDLFGCRQADGGGDRTAGSAWPVVPAAAAADSVTTPIPASTSAARSSGPGSTRLVARDNSTSMSTEDTDDPAANLSTRRESSARCASGRTDCTATDVSMQTTPDSPATIGPPVLDHRLQPVGIGSGLNDPAGRREPASGRPELPGLEQGAEWRRIGRIDAGDPGTVTGDLRPFSRLDTGDHFGGALVQLADRHCSHRPIVRRLCQTSPDTGWLRTPRPLPAGPPPGRPAPVRRGSRRCAGRAPASRR